MASIYGSYVESTYYFETIVQKWWWMLPCKHLKEINLKIILTHISGQGSFLIK